MSEPSKKLSARFARGKRSGLAARRAARNRERKKRGGRREPVTPSAWGREKQLASSASVPVERRRRTSVGPTTGQAPPPPSRTLSPNWTVDRSAVERHRLLRVERRPGSYPVLTLILRSYQSPALAIETQVSDSMTPA